MLGGTNEIVAFVPLKLQSQRVPGKNLRPLNGKPLWHWIIRTLLEVKGLSEIYVFASEAWFDKVRDFGHPAIRHVHRPSGLDEDGVLGSELYKAFAEKVPSRYYLLAHATSPFLKSRTVDECVERVLRGPYDSALTAVRHQTFVRDSAGAPLNFTPNNMPPTQNLPPIYSDTSSLYLFSESHLKSGRRTGSAPFLKEVGLIEGLDIDSESDFSLAEELSQLRLPLVADSSLTGNTT